MKKIIILGFVVITVILFATNMVVHTTSGDESFELDEIISITFNPGNIPTDYVAYYPFNGNADDQSEYENDGMPEGGVNFNCNDRFENPNSAACFDGDDDYINCGTAATLNITGSLTVSAWVKTTSYGAIANKVLHDTQNAYDDAWELKVINDGRVYFDVTDGVDDPHLFSEETVNDDNWRHVVAVFNAAEGYTKIVIDNLHIVQMDAPSFIIDNLDTPLFLGAAHQYDWDTEQHLDGCLDDIRVYSRALSDDEIDALYHEGGWE